MPRRSVRLVAALAALIVLDTFALADTRQVTVAPGGEHKFQDQHSGTSTSTIVVGDTVQWFWLGVPHSTTSGTCSPTCTPDGVWDSFVVETLPHIFAHTFGATGTYHYYCRVHLTSMQGTVIVVDAGGPAPTVTSISPTSGPADAGTAVTIEGTNFINGAGATIGGVDATGVVFQDAQTLKATTPFPLTPGTLNDVTVFQWNPDFQSATLTGGWLADFNDVPQADIFHDYVETLVRNGVTAGCGGGNYCRDTAVTRAQMAVFILKALYGSSYVPPPCAHLFADVPCVFNQYATWIEELYNLGVTGGCSISPLKYCPDALLSRQQMSVFLLKAEHGSAYTPPACTGIFGDVPCTPGFGFPDWIEQLYHENITGGCSTTPPLFCPTNPNIRGQMAVLLVKTFGLQ